MNKGNSLIIGTSILVGFLILGVFLKLTFSEKGSPTTIEASTTGIYEMIAVNKNNIIIFNKQNGEYWRKFISDSEGPTEWTKEPSPVSNTK
ncbi:hypothetical protein [Paenibacillus sp. DMB5]|uniref:hypothetical protein n=1 Tax=Paenibacillus sp. DMB5 TaxID=1780103 RepID=UPI00076CBE4A|nr:hypothetical protein [Paenibacillus sp. DMB5]KUP25370.1 hypothetical protein AWJ19_07905 [Paenibacillus sp. DMB5]